LLETCPFNPEHVAPSIIVTVADTGAMGFRCSHNSCFDKLWLDFRKTVEAIIGHAFEFAEKAPPLDPEHIVTNPGHVSEMIRRSEAVLYDFGLKYFERNNELVNTAYGRDVAKLKDIERSADSVVIQPASRETILRDLDSRAVFVRRIETSLGTIEKVVHVPKLLPDQLHDRVRSEVRDVVFPTLDMVTASPVLLPSGAVHGVGKVFEEGVMFIGAHTKRFPEVPEHPTRAHALTALQQFDDIFCDFPFVDPGSEGLNWKLTASYSVALAGVLSLVARPYLGLGAMPVIGATAPSRRSGKTKIIEAACMAALGHRPTACHFTDEVEFDKHVQPLMRAGDRAILIDNVERSLQSSKLCILVTGGVLRDRVLGESRDVILKNYSVIFATGNNLVFGGDLSARAIRSDIDPQTERPESRAFSFDPVKLAQERHPQLVVAALTILRAYLLAGAPWNLGRAPWGGFERWDKLVAGCLVWLGAPDPYMARERIIAADPVRTSNLDLLEDWYLRYKDRPVSFTDIRTDKGAVYESLLKHGSWDGYQARWILRRLEGQTVGGYTLRRIGGRSQFQVLKAGESQGEMYARRVEEPPATAEKPPLEDDDDGTPF
jgi:putative DNA primase/helicase